MPAMTTPNTRSLGALVAALAVLISANGLAARQVRPAVKSPRLYVFDCGMLEGDPARFNLKREEMATTNMSVACYLVVHPKGVLMWDTGALPDADVTSEGKPTRYHLVLADKTERYVTTTKTLKGQLSEAGYTPKDVTHLAVSHYHYDHTANNNDFAGATWLISQIERDAMFADKPPSMVERSTFNALQKSKTIILKTDEYDVFGDGAVVIKSAPGHTPGHQVLLVKLAKTGPVLLTGDLYHYPEERTLDRVPTFDSDPAQNRKTRAAMDAYAKKNGARLWIQHDFKANAALEKSPSFYD
jgi:N-acyl homoserine lactone hydrolase